MMPVALIDCAAVLRRQISTLPHRRQQLPTIPAIVGQIDNAAAEDMQLAENIQRENLSLIDEAAAVRRLHGLNGYSVTIVAERLHKSKSWVSKRLAASCPDLRQMAREILEKWNEYFSG